MERMAVWTRREFECDMAILQTHSLLRWAGWRHHEHGDSRPRQQLPRQVGPAQTLAPGPGRGRQRDQVRGAADRRGERLSE